MKLFRAPKTQWLLCRKETHPSNHCWPLYRYWMKMKMQSLCFYAQHPPQSKGQRHFEVNFKWMSTSVHRCVLLFPFSLKIGEDNGMLEINRKLAGRVKQFYLTIAESKVFSCFFKVTVLSPSTGGFKCCPDLLVKGVQRRWSKWSELIFTSVCTLVVGQVLTRADIPEVACNLVISGLATFVIKSLKSHCKPHNLFCNTHIDSILSLA